MDVLDAFIMGLVQGLAEYLPISSSGHLEICGKVLGLDLQGAEALDFSVALHVATVLSTIVILWREFAGLCSSFFRFKRDENTTYVLKILLSCIPVAIVGLFFEDKVEAFFGENLTVVGLCLMVTAGLLAFSYFFPRRKANLKADGTIRQHDIRWIDAFVIGCAQAVAVLPGLSRSGSTIATGLILGNRSDKLAQFSFFMVVIPILGKALLDVKDILFPDAVAETSDSVGFLPLFVGFMTAFIVGCLACKWMINLVKKGKLVWFSLYCAIAGAVCLIW